MSARKYAEKESPENIPTPAGLITLVGSMDDTQEGQQIKVSALYMEMELATVTLEDKSKIQILGGMGPNLIFTYKGRSAVVSAEKLVRMVLDFGLADPFPMDFPKRKAVQS